MVIDDINPTALSKATIASFQPPIKIAVKGQLTINSATTEVVHGLGYVPMVKVWAYQKSASELGNYQQIATFLTWHYGFLSTPDVTWYATTNSVFFTNSVNGPITIIYRIYYDD